MQLHERLWRIIKRFNTHIAYRIRYDIINEAYLNYLKKTKIVYLDEMYLYFYLLSTVSVKLPK